MPARLPIAATLLFATTLFLAAPIAAADQETPPSPRPLRALLITGGCCHDYAFQSERIVEGTTERALVEWKVVHDPRRGTRGELDLYDDPDWAKPYDVVVHNECFAATADPEYIRKITKAHHDGVPALVIHCAMHTHRAATIDDWREFLGVTSRRHDHQSEYPVTVVAEEHPVMAGFPANWKSPKDELYVIEKVWPRTTVLATAKSERDGNAYAGFWVSEYGKARVFGTTFGHGNATFADEVFIDTLCRGLLWVTGKLGEDGKPLPGYEPRAAAVGRPGETWAHEQAAKLPDGEKATLLFDGKSLDGWSGAPELWSVADGEIVGRNRERVATSSYLFTEKEYRDFRLLFEVRQTRSPEHSTMHSAVAVLGERFDDKGNAFGFKGPLLMFCQDWGIWDAHRRNRVEPAGHAGQFHPEGVERIGEWNRIEVLVRGDRIRFVANGKLVFDFTDEKEMLQASPIGLQLHANRQAQEYHFRGLVLSESPKDALVTLER